MKQTYISPTHTQLVLFNKIANMIAKEIIRKPEVKVEFIIEHSDKNCDLCIHVSSINGYPYTGYIQIKEQKYTLYYFPLPGFKEVVEEIAKYFKKKERKEIKIKKAPCHLKCRYFKKCMKNSPTVIQIEQLGLYTKKTCILFNPALKYDREFIKRVVGPLKM